MSKEIEAFQTAEVTCPYCSFEFSDSWEFGSLRSDGDSDEMECDECGKKFYVRCNLEISYTSSGLCKENNKKHNWEYFDFSSEDDGKRCYGRKCLTCGKYEFDKTKEDEEVHKSVSKNKEGKSVA